MKIVVLDGYALNPGDLDWSGLAPFGQVQIYERTPEDLILERTQGAEILLTNKTPLSGAVLSRLPVLRYIGVLATGYNVVDVKAAGRLGIVVSNVPAYATQSVAQMVFALLFALCRRVEAHSDAVRAGAWSRSQDFCFWLSPQVELKGKIMGIVGFGRIGRRVAAIASACGMRPWAADVAQRGRPNLPGFAWCELPDLLRAADVVSLHCPLTAQTAGLINRERLALMKPSAYLINTARGPLVYDADLADALNRGVIAGAGLDVLSEEPPRADDPLLTAKNCVITPHIAWATFEARSHLVRMAVENLEAFLDGRPMNVVSGISA